MQQQPSMTNKPGKESADPIFHPRRFAHANLWVSDYQRSAEFYKSIAGFNEVYRQPDNRASFLSNGNTYHDFAITDLTSKYAKPGQPPGLFHLALELETEADLVRSYERAVAANLNLRSTVDHDVAHSVYLYDPDGTVLEVYADVDADWRSHRQGTIIKAKPKWVPGVTTRPLDVRLYPDNPPIDKVEEAVFHGKRVTHVALVTEQFEAMCEYYRSVVGLDVLAGQTSGDYMVLKGHAGKGDLSLFRRRAEIPVGMHHVGIEVWDEADLAGSLSKLAGRGITLEREVDHPARRAVTISDPDGIRLQFHVNRDWRPEALAGLAFDDALWLL